VTPPLGFAIYVPACPFEAAQLEMTEHSESGDLSDFRLSVERAVERVVINAVLGEQFRERFAVVLFDGVAEGAE